MLLLAGVLEEEVMVATIPVVSILQPALLTPVVVEVGVMMAVRVLQVVPG
jgi:hypothetical protein